MVGGVLTVTERLGELALPQGPEELVATTETLPETALPLIFTVIKLPVAEPTMENPAGSVHVYEVAFGTGVME